jgi:class 3 adenylate cyclase
MIETENYLSKTSYQLEKFAELIATLNMISNWMVLPLYFLFWIADIVYFPDLKWQFLALRAIVIPTCYLVQKRIKKTQTFLKAESLALFFIFILALIINCMIFLIRDASTPYYAGLNLVALGSLTFIPWSNIFFVLAIGSIYLPYWVFNLAFLTNSENYKFLFVHTFFIVGTVVISFVIRKFHENLRGKEFESRLKLNDEITNRDVVITTKTNEALRLATLSTQFSPQVVDAIRNNKLSLNENIHRSNICAIFIDIVNSTDRVARVDKDKVHRTISTFVDDSIKILLKYDITIDKFLGDGLLAFSNDPIAHSDFMNRTVLAALEIRRQVKSRQSFYEDNWMAPLEIRIGIASGFANVGFYGNEKYFKSYTAIGPVINLASRLCNTALSNQIVCSSEVLEKIDKNEFQIKSLGKVTLKGFEADTIKAFEINSVAEQSSEDLADIECTICSTGLLYLDTDANGHYILKCRNCGAIKDQTTSALRKKVA